MQSILFPIVKGVACDHTFDYTVGLAKRMMSDVMILCPLQNGENEGARENASKNRAFGEILKLKSSYQEKFNESCYKELDINFDYKFYNGPFFEGIINQVDQNVTNLVVLHYPVLQYVYGDNKEKIDLIIDLILERTACPVLIVPENVGYTLFDNIVIKADFSKMKYITFDSLKQMANKYKSNVTFFQSTVLDKNINNMNGPLSMAEELSGIDSRFKVKYFNNNRNIEQSVDHGNLDAYIVRKKSTFQKIFNRKTRISDYRLKFPTLVVCDLIN